MVEVSRLGEIHRDAHQLDYDAHNSNGAELGATIS